MNAFDEGCEIERRGMEALLLYARRTYGEAVKTSREDQWRGDLRFPKGSSEWFVECKVEERNKHGNLFLESWSNKKWMTLGWFMPEVNQADGLWYYFLESDELYTCNLQLLRAWAFGNDESGFPRICQFDEKPQGKYTQKNDSWGYCVPIQVLLSERIIKGPTSVCLPRS